MKKQILLQLILLASVMSNDPNCSQFKQGVCSECNPHFMLKQGKCTPVHPQQDQKPNTQNPADKRIESPQSERYSRRLQSVQQSANNYTNPLPTASLLFWKQRISQVKDNKTITEEYLQGPTGPVSVHAVNELLRFVNQYNAAYSNLPPIVLRNGRDFILANVQTRVSNISFSACTCNQPISIHQLQSIREFAVQINKQNIKNYIYNQIQIEGSPPPPPLPPKPFAFDPNLTISITLRNVSSTFFSEVFTMLNIFNSQNKIKEADLIIVNETGYQIYPNNTANVRRFFFLTEEGSINLTYAYNNFTRFLVIQLKQAKSHYFDAYFPEPQPTRNYYCLTQDPTGRFCLSCFAGFTLRNGECLKQESYCQRYNPYEGVCVRCNRGYYRHRLGPCLKANVSEFCVQFNNKTGRCTQCQYLYQISNGQCSRQASPGVSPSSMSPGAFSTSSTQRTTESFNQSTITLTQTTQSIKNYEQLLDKTILETLQQIARIEDQLRWRRRNPLKTNVTKTSNQFPSPNIFIPASYPSFAGPNITATPHTNGFPFLPSTITYMIPSTNTLPVSSLYSAPTNSNLLRSNTSNPSVSVKPPKPTTVCTYCGDKGS